MAIYEIKDGVGIIPEGTTVIEEGAFEEAEELTSVVIPNSVTKIDVGAFSGCTSLTSIIIPDSVTEIEYYAFYGCTSLKSIDIPNSVTTIGVDAFQDCVGLTSLVISSSVTKIGREAFGAFRGCKNLVSIVVSESNPVYDSRNNCNAIIETASNSLILGCRNTVIPDTVTKISGDAFFGGTAPSDITFPESVTVIGSDSDILGDIGAFKDCVGVTNIVIPESVTNIFRSAFEGCTDLKTVEIKAKPKYIDTEVFRNCTSLESVILPAGIGKFKNGDWGYPTAFEGCTALKAICVPAKKADYYKKRLPQELHRLIVEQ